MSERAAKEVGADPICMAAMNEVIEAWMDAAGPKASREFMRAVAARVATPVDAKVVPVRGPRGAQVLTARVWLQTRLPAWLSRYG